MNAAVMDAPLLASPLADRAILIRAATDADNDQLLALTRVTPMAGRIALRIDRDPDFFALLRRRGDAIVLVASCKDQVIGCISAAIHDGYVDGMPEKVAHIGDLKVDPLFSGQRLSSHLTAALESHLKQIGIDVCVALIADGNNRVTSVRTGRHGTPAGVPLGHFIVDQLLARPMWQRDTRYAIEQATTADLPAIAAMLDETYRRRQFAPRITVEHLSSSTAMSSPETPFAVRMVAREGARVVATLALEDTFPLRQNVLIGAPATLRWGFAAARPFALLVPQLTIPRLGRPIRTLYVRHMACAPDAVDALRLLVDDARARAFRGGFTFLSVGLHQRDPLRSAVTGRARVTFRSLLFAARILTQAKPSDRNSQIPYEDFALV